MAFRWSDLPFPWQAAVEQAWTAYRTGSVPVGAVVVDAEGVILGRGRNGMEEPPGESRLYRHHLAHAELNALLAVARPASELHACSLYSTLEPCPLCMGAVYMSGVRSLYYAASDPHAGSVNLLGATPYLSLKPVAAWGPGPRSLELFCGAIHTEYRLRRHAHNGADPVIARWRPALPEIVALGEGLYSHGFYPTAGKEGWDVQTAMAAVLEGCDLALNGRRVA
ncbi:MAG: nucleoside deaminase [Chloroflexi bacterium]|nr:nucleoside deaminase [Anaerolineaceae bacterium]NMB89574.1 nucleoside deaminase [Chloroflexota bacterium]